MIDAPWIVRDNEGREMPLDDARSYLARSRNEFMLKARQHRDVCRNYGHAFSCHQVGNHVRLARECQHHLLAVRRQHRSVGVQATLFETMP